MKTPATEEFPEIEWDQESILETDVDERLEVWIMKGYDAAGISYSGLGYYTCGELDVLNDIEIKMNKTITYV